ncbi:hypothetical protein [Streptomyces rubiginosohelvolus]
MLVEADAEAGEAFVLRLYVLDGELGERDALPTSVCSVIISSVIERSDGLGALPRQCKSGTGTVPG